VLKAIEKEAPFCEETAGQEALQTLVHRLASATATSFPLTVQVSNAPVVNAVALPGGKILMFRGLLESAATIRATGE